MTRASKPCLNCGALFKGRGGYCGACRPGNPTYQETQRRRRTVQTHVAEYGAWCPGYWVDAHESFDLTADHIFPRARGGDRGPLQVLCRACNARKKDHDPPGPDQW